MTSETFKTASKLKIETDEKRLIVNRIAAEMKLRQWCMEQAMKNCNDADNIQKMAETAYNFVTKTD